MTALQSPTGPFAEPNHGFGEHDHPKLRKPILPSEKLTSQKAHRSQRQQDSPNLRSIKDSWVTATKTTTTPNKPAHQPSLPNTTTTPTSTTSLTELTKKSASKVSHVICKFYKAGNCSAGSACQFSHNLPEVGQGKPICQWFVKGNCRFAHKCALAHILPGQPMSMDRKNKRAAQTAAREASAPINSSDESHPLSNSPPELSFDLAQALPHQTPNSRIELNESADYHRPDSAHPVHSLRKSSIHQYTHHLMPESDGDHHINHLTDELEFGLPDDFANTSLRSNPMGYRLSPQSAQAAHFSVAVTSAAPPHFTSDVFGELRAPLLHSRPVSPDPSRVPISIARNGAWPRDQSPSPFGFGSPFSAPGSRSVFLPRPGSFGSEDGFPRSAPSVGASPRQASFMSNANLLDDNMMWNHIDTEDDVTELLPSSLHSLLTPEERQRQHLRKHTQHLFSQSVPSEHLVGSLHKQANASTLRHNMTMHDPPSLSVSPMPTLAVRSGSPTSVSLAHQRETSASTIRPHSHAQLSSSYVPASGAWQNFSQQAELAQHLHTLSPPLISSPRTDNGFFGHAPGSSLPQGLAAGLSRLHFQPPLHTGLTPSCSPSSHSLLAGQPPAPIGRDGTTSPPTTSAYFTEGLRAPSALSQRLAGLHLGSSNATSIGKSLHINSSPLSRNVSYGVASPFDHDEMEDRTDRYLHSDRFREDDAPFELEI